MKFWAFHIACYAAILIFVAACNGNNNAKDIRDYYFPLKTLQEGLVYEYRSLKGDTLSPDYWYYRSIIQDTAVFLTATLYGPDFEPLQFAREEWVSNGVLMNDLYLYEADTTGKHLSIPVQILSGNVFPFQVRDSSAILFFKITWTDPAVQKRKTTLTKNRRYIGTEKYVFQGKSYPCVVFEVRALFEVEDEGVLEQEFHGVEYYARGLGLVYYRKNISPTLVLEYGLSDRYPMETLEDKFQRALRNNY